MNPRYPSRQAFLWCGVATIWLLSVCLDAAAQWQQGFDFRNTANFVTDPAGDTYVPPKTAYSTKGKRVTYDWVKTSLVQARDRNARLDPLLPGINYVNNGSPATFYLDLPSPRTYKLPVANADNTMLARLTDGVTKLGYFHDTTENNRSAAAWPASDDIQQKAGANLTVTGQQYDVGIDFRNTQNYVTDPAYAVFDNCVNDGITQQTSTNSNGQSVTWQWSRKCNAAMDVSNGVDPRLAGIANTYTASGGETLTVTVPQPGTYNIGFATGTAGGNQCGGGEVSQFYFQRRGQWKSAVYGKSQQSWHGAFHRRREQQLDSGAVAI